MEATGWIALCYALGTFVAVAFATYAFIYGHWWIKHSKNRDTEDFITARGTQNIWRIGWSFYAGAVGAWVIVAPAQYAQFSGIVGVVVYALASGLPILVVALFGSWVTREMPHVFSISDYVGWRFGPIAKTIVFLVALFNMSIALLAEYTTIGSIFSDFVGSVSWGIIVVVGVLTLLYTAYGGLATSIATDQAQGVASMLMAALLTIYVAVTFRTPLPKPLPAEYGPNPAGYIAIFTLSASLLSSTMFSEAVWQRVWASAGRRALFGGAAVGCSAIIILVFLSGFGGWLAFVSGRAEFGVTNPNVYLMQVIGTHDTAANTVDSWVDLFVVLLAIVMNEGAVDSLQNGIAASISGHFLKNSPLSWTRLAVILLNIPLVVIGTRGFAVLSLFLVGNLLTCCAIVPLVAGLVPALRSAISETAFVLGVIGGVLGVTATGIAINWVPGSPSSSLSYGAYWAWVDNYYDWRPFLAALCCSTAVLLVVSAVAWLLRRAGVSGPGLSGLLMRVPGMKALTATPHWPPQDEQRLPAWGPGKSVPAGPSARSFGQDSSDGIVVCDGGSGSIISTAPKDVDRL